MGPGLFQLRAMSCSRDCETLHQQGHAANQWQASKYSTLYPALALCVWRVTKFKYVYTVHVCLCGFKCVCVCILICMRTCGLESLPTVGFVKSAVRLFFPPYNLSSFLTDCLSLDSFCISSAGKLTIHLNPPRSWWLSCCGNSNTRLQNTRRFWLLQISKWWHRI